MNTDKKLVVIYKERDAIAVDMLRKLIEKGHKDIQLMAFTEKVWIDNKNTGNFGRMHDHVMFINDIKGSKGVQTIITKHFDNYGIEIGYDGTRGILITKSGALSEAKDYCEFLKGFVELREADNEKLLSGETNERVERIAAHKFFSKVVKGKSKIRNQQLIYGATVLAENYLEDFLQEG